MNRFVVFVLALCAAILACNAPEPFSGPVTFTNITPIATRVTPLPVSSPTNLPTFTPRPLPSATPVLVSTRLPGIGVIHSTPKFQVFILSPLTTCLVGNEFASGSVCAGAACGDCNCTWEEHDPPAPHTGVPPARLADPAYAGFQHKTCVEITLTEQEIQNIMADMRQVRDLAYAWTEGALDLQLEFTVLPHAYTGFTAPDFVIGPFEIDDELLNAYVGTDTDFVYVVSGVFDRAKNQRLAYWCGSSYGSLTVHGAGYSYIQYNDICGWVTLGGRRMYEPLVHEWIHNLDWALYYVNDVPDLYQEVGPDWEHWKHGSWPACGMGSPDPHNWFPSIDFCEWDPDWMDCNNVASAGFCPHAGEVGGNISWYEHVLSAHYPRHIQFIGNFCRDGRQNFSETGVDTGSPCP